MGMREDCVHLETFWGGILSGVTFSGRILSRGIMSGGIMPVPLYLHVSSIYNLPSAAIILYHISLA